MKIIVDCNIWISFLLGHQTALMQRILTDNMLDVFVCHELLAEIKSVAGREKIRRYVTSSDVSDLLNLLHDFCVHSDIRHSAVTPIRDAKDLYLLSLAETVEADYLVSGDKDLLVLENHGKTKMITLAAFKMLRGM